MSSWPPLSLGETIEPLALDMALKLIKQGAFPETAFLAAGLSPKALLRLQLGQSEEDRARYREILQAVGMARAMAEINAHKEITRSWLINGPGALIRELPRWGSKKEPEVANVDFLLVLGQLAKELNDRPAERAIILRALHKLDPDCLFGAEPSQEAP
jgi:hypothetical protein